MQIVTYYPAGMVKDRFAVHAEADPQEEFRGAVEAATAGEAVELLDAAGKTLKLELIRA